MRAKNTPQNLRKNGVKAMKKSILEKMDEMGIKDVGEYFKTIESEFMKKYEQPIEDENMTDKELVGNWKPVNGYEGLYLVSDEGKVWSQKTQKLMKYTTLNGYKRVKLFKNGEQFEHYVHRLVARAFIGAPTGINPDGTPFRTDATVDHINSIRGDNRVENLRWCDLYYNISRAVHNPENSGAPGKKVICTTTGQVFESTKEASEVLGVPQGHISRICIAKRDNLKGNGVLHSTKGLKFEFVS